MCTIRETPLWASQAAASSRMLIEFRGAPTARLVPPGARLVGASALRVSATNAAGEAVRQEHRSFHRSAAGIAMRQHHAFYHVRACRDAVQTQGMWKTVCFASPGFRADDSFAASVTILLRVAVVHGLCAARSHLVHTIYLHRKNPLRQRGGPWVADPRRLHAAGIQWHVGGA